MSLLLPESLFPMACMFNRLFKCDSLDPLRYRFSRNKVFVIKTEKQDGLCTINPIEPPRFLFLMNSTCFSWMEFDEVDWEGQPSTSIMPTTLSSFLRSQPSMVRLVKETFVPLSPCTQTLINSQTGWLPNEEESVSGWTCQACLRISCFGFGRPNCPSINGQLPRDHNAAKRLNSCCCL